MAIRCCNGCVPPKRHLACWETCPDYAREKEKHRAEKERIKKAKQEEQVIDSYIASHAERTRKRLKKK